jgi:alpha-tubulin suppressor-like RCC1 family protein
MLGRSGSAAPARIESLSGVKAISAGNHTAYALMSDGTVKAWGDNLYGRVGVASEDGMPATIPGLSDVVEVNGAEFHGMALTRSGAVYTWGRNELKVLNGTDTPFQSDAPILSGFFR